MTSNVSGSEKRLGLNSTGSLPWSSEKAAGGTIEPSMWLFVVGEMTIFVAYFAVYMFERGNNHASFLAAQQHLSKFSGLANTLILLTSSWFLAQAVDAARRGNRQQASAWVVLSAGSGVAFVVSKAHEYGLLIDQGFIITSGDFFAFYFIMTGLHIFHVVIGLGVLAYMWARTQSPVLDAPHLETCSAYWHMVDVVWIILFASLYFAG